MASEGIEVAKREGTAAVLRNEIAKTTFAQRSQCQLEANLRDLSLVERWVVEKIVAANIAKITSKETTEARGKHR